MVMEDGRPKGMKRVLEERGINTSKMSGDDMRIVLANHDDFKTEKTIVKHLLNQRGHVVLFIPKFHCELNPIERVWGQAKVFTTHIQISLLYDSARLWTRLRDHRSDAHILSKD